MRGLNGFHLIRLLALVLSLAGIAGGPAQAGAFEEGQAAYDSGQLRKAYETWLPLAEAGDCRAQFDVSRVLSELGTSYLLYGEVESDDSWAYRTFDANGINRDELSSSWIMRAAEQGHAYAQLLIAEGHFNRYFFDDIVGLAPAPTYETYPEELRPERKILALMAKEEELAWIWYERAADNGEPYALYMLSYRASREGDRVSELTWALLAGVRGYGWFSQQVADSLRNELTAAQFAEAERRAAEWRAAHADVKPWGSC